MLDVKVSSRGSGSQPNISQFVGNDDGIWEGCRFHINAPIGEADVWLVVEDVDDEDTTCCVPQNSVIFLSAETSWPLGFYDGNSQRREFLDQFSWIYTCHDIYRPNVTADLPYLPWMVNANHGPSITRPHERDVNFLRRIDSIDKQREISVICSRQSATDGHRMRLRFVEKLKEHFGDRLDWFGNDVNPIPDKWSGLAPYKYTVSIENQMAINVATEKLWDPYLTLTFPIYAGAPNIGDILPRDSFLAINARDLNGSIETIEGLLEDDPYSFKLPGLRAARDEILGRLNLYSRYAKVAHRHAGHGRKSPVTIAPMAHMDIRSGASRDLVRAVGEQINKVGDLLVQQSIRGKDRT